MAAKTYLQSCLLDNPNYDNSTCAQAQNLYCANTDDLAGLCACVPTFYFDTVANKCVDKNLNGLVCSNASACRTDLGLNCLAGYCSCPTTFYWSPISLMCSKLSFSTHLNPLLYIDFYLFVAFIRCDN